MEEGMKAGIRMSNKGELQSQAIELGGKRSDMKKEESVINKLCEKRSDLTKRVIIGCCSVGSR